MNEKGNFTNFLGSNIILLHNATIVSNLIHDNVIFKPFFFSNYISSRVIAGCLYELAKSNIFFT